MNMGVVEDAGERVVVTSNRAEIVTTAPFQSVKEAVAMFGERVLAEELKSKMPASATSHVPSRLGMMTSELEETRESLKKAEEESLSMARSLNSLREELEITRRELFQLKAREYRTKPPIESEIEDLKFVENATEVEKQHPIFCPEAQFQRRLVKFADAPSLGQGMTMGTDDAELGRHSSFVNNRRRKKKPLTHLIEGIFSKKKGIQEVSPESARARAPPTHNS